MGEENNFIPAVSVLVGTCIGAGILGIPYVASRAGFPVALFYILFIGGIVFLLNLYLGEVSLRTKENHQLAGYAEKYLGKNARKLMEFALIFGVYSAIVAYMFGVGESLSTLIFGNLSYSILFGSLFGLLMSLIIYQGVKDLKKYEKFFVGIVLILVISIVVFFSGKINYNNLNFINYNNFLLPFGVILFALLSFAAIPEVALILKKEKKKMKKVIFTGSIIAILVYSLFTFVVVGFKGAETPELATLALGALFIFLGIFTMTTSHLSLGNALLENFTFDDKYKKSKAWFFASILPILVYLIISFSGFFSFTKILSIGGVVSGGITAVLILFMVKKAKTSGERKPEYTIPINWFLIIIISLIFTLGVLRELFLVIRGF